MSDSRTSETPRTDDQCAEEQASPHADYHILRNGFGGCLVFPCLFILYVWIHACPLMQEFILIFSGMDILACIVLCSVCLASWGVGLGDFSDFIDYSNEVFCHDLIF